jgi:hypothetical protein
VNDDLIYLIFQSRERDSGGYLPRTACNTIASTLVSRAEGVVSVEPLVLCARDKQPREEFVIPLKEAHQEWSRRTASDSHSHGKFSEAG